MAEKKTPKEKCIKITTKPTFEESIPIIQKELQKRRHKWQLHAIAWMDWSDVEQIILTHLFIKWVQYNPELPLVNWVNRIISNQITNVRRNLYDAYSRPCLKCPEAQGVEHCAIYQVQCNKCPLYAKWEKTKKYAHDCKLPVSSENHTNEISEMPGENYDYPKAEQRLHEEMKKILKPHEWKIYNLLFIKNLTDLQVAKEMGYKSSEGRSPGYATIAKIKKIIIKKAHQIKEKIDLF
jgi:hypothetical protein